jgi:hypothetical protein
MPRGVESHGAGAGRRYRQAQPLMMALRAQIPGGVGRQPRQLLAQHSRGRCVRHVGGGRTQRSLALAGISPQARAWHMGAPARVSPRRAIEQDLAGIPFVLKSTPVFLRSRRARNGPMKLEARTAPGVLGMRRFAYAASGLATRTERAWIFSVAPDRVTWMAVIAQANRTPAAVR